MQKSAVNGSQGIGVAVCVEVGREVGSAVAVCVGAISVKVGAGAEKVAVAGGVVVEQEARNIAAHNQRIFRFIT
jgi:hypothetical protein